MYSCAHVPTHIEMENDIKNYTLPGKPKDNEGVVYVIRPSSAGFLVRFNVFLDNASLDKNEMGWNRGSQHLYFYAKEGQHTIYSKAENTATATFEVKKGEPTFLIQDAKLGFIMARNDLRIADDIEGKYQVKNTELGTIKKYRLKN